MDDLISRQALMQSLGITDMDCDKCAWHDKESCTCKRGGDFVDACCAIEDAPTIEERKTGKWDERSVFDTEDSGIAQMQSAKCSACGKYHTTPYLYFFDNFNFCPNCGADNRGEE